MSEPWPIETVPDADLLFKRVPLKEIQGGKPIPGVFRNLGEGEQEGMSTDWSNYSTPEETKKRATNPAWRGGVIQMGVGDVRKIPHQTVVHAPLPDNRAHTNVKGPKSGGVEGTQARYLFMRVWRWAIEYKDDGPVQLSKPS
ncbi:MAG: hypothetical protein HYY24_06020 [Verrucomicrobia bacterium]|nr:hypothetical protein [Verrucomicrobiota bacterium]